MDGRYFSTTKKGESDDHYGDFMSHCVMVGWLYSQTCSTNRFIFITFSSLAGEIHEFKQDLNAVDRGKKKDAVKKVIAGMHHQGLKPTAK